MLFNSYIFIFGYLPITLAGFFCIARCSHKLAALWLAAASLFFYGWWNPLFVGLILASITANYAFGHLIGHARQAGVKRAQLLLLASVIANLGLLAYFKYANFFVATTSQLFSLEWAALEIVLPLGISFFTFTQIAFLVDVYRGIVREYNFILYVLFVTYFPHLIAGPVLHHKQMMPQFGHSSTYQPNAENIALGVTIFALGLSKKVLIADNLAECATPIFSVASAGHSLMLFEAWVGALAYTLQLYFDFSGYSDMAIGLSLLFNVRLPLNFDSPYKATNIIDFWRRWHITLSSFLRDYLYIPLGGGRKGQLRRYSNLMITMLLGGLWHGAGWTFVIWGGLHGLYLMINHGWRGVKNQLGLGGGGYTQLFSGAVTFLAVVVAWVFFRAESVSTALSMLEAMLGFNGVSVPQALEMRMGSLMSLSARTTIIFDGFLPVTGIHPGKTLVILVVSLLLVWCFPNVRQILRNYKPTWNDFSESKGTVSIQNIHHCDRLLWKPKFLIGVMLGALFVLSLSDLNKTSEFLYFQF